MKTVKVIEGVVAEFEGKYWGTQYSDGHSTQMDFGDFEKADISDPEYCKKPTDKTYDPKNTNGYNPHYDKLSKAKLVKVKKTITTEFEVITDKALHIGCVVCSKPNSKYLTEGKQYEIEHDSMGSGYFVRNDAGKIAYYSKMNFL